jgi:surface polysaccharide O-acyltransferase-like enzyme
MLIAYFPSYYIAHQKVSFIAYVKDFFVVEKWPVGPPWFIWMLFFFNFLFLLLYRPFQKAGKKTEVCFSKIGKRPFSFFFALFFITWMLYVPIAYCVGAGTWTGFGPFDFQLSRIFLYFGYFILGVLIGNTDFNKNIFSEKSAIVKKWWLWIILSAVIYFMLIIIENPLTQWVKSNPQNEFYAWMVYYTIYVASCSVNCIAFITVFRQFVRSEKFLLNSLSENAYLIYLVHYIFVIWCQFMLLEFNLPALVKFFITFAFSFTLSWIVSNSLRKIKIILKYI